VLRIALVQVHIQNNKAMAVEHTSCESNNKYSPYSYNRIQKSIESSVLNLIDIANRRTEE
jgi:hypothetical protein